MTRRERNLWLMVGLAIVLAIFYYVWNNREFGTINRPSQPTGGDGSVATFQLTEAYRLLRAEPNIRHRQKAVAALRNKIESQFFSARDPEAAQLALLKLTEKLGLQAGLTVDQKNLTTLKTNYIAITLEGKTTPASFTRFLQFVGAENAPINLEVHRLQVHALPEQRLLDYQLVVAALLITKKGISNGG